MIKYPLDLIAAIQVIQIIIFSLFKGFYVFYLAIYRPELFEVRNSPLDKSATSSSLNKSLIFSP